MEPWMDTIEELTNVALTVEAQTATLPDDEVHLGEDLFPREDVDSVDVADVTVEELRPESETREWNAPGVTLPKPTGRKFGMNILPIEARDQIDEHEAQKLAELELLAGEDALHRRLIIKIPERIRYMALANQRALERKRYRSWLEGLMVQHNPQNRNQEITTQFPWRADRIEEAGTPWNNAGVNAYDEFLAWAKEGVEELGALEGAMLRQSLLDVIRADGPVVAGTDRPLRIEDLEAEIRSELGVDFSFLVNRSWTGSKNNRVMLHPVPRIALVPAGGAVGKTLFAPVNRAIEVYSQIPDGEEPIDVRGNAAYRETSNEGKRQQLSVQLNAAPAPDEALVWVMNTGVNA